jgi:hypothetical protein
MFDTSMAQRRDMINLPMRNTVPVLELIRLGTGSDAAAIVLCVVLIVNNGTSALGSAVAMSRQGYAFARVFRATQIHLLNMVFAMVSGFDLTKYSSPLPPGSVVLSRLVSVHPDSDQGTTSVRRNSLVPCFHKNDIHRLLLNLEGV